MPKKIRYALETAAVYAAYFFFRLLPLNTASNLGGWIGRSFGPGFGASNIARRNLKRAFPKKSEDEIESIIIGMWDNLGRTAAEYAHLHRIQNNIELLGAEYLDAARDSQKPSIFFAAHLANWEINATCAKRRGLDVHLVYRKPNNPGVDGLLRHARDSGAAGHIEKGAGGARDMISVLKKGGALGILIDQKLNEGMAIPFFGRDAMTAPAIAHFALKFGCPIYPSRIERLKGAHFRMTVFPPLEISPTGDQERDTRAILTEINRRLESWIRERPEQWLWIHRRWPE